MKRWEKNNKINIYGKKTKKTNKQTNSPDYIIIPWRVVS